MASFSFDPGPIPLARQPYLIVVQRYDAASSGAGNSPFAFLPNVVCLSVTKREGDPGSARFRYVTSDVDPDSPFPLGFEQLIDVNATGPYAVHVDDRVVVQAISPDDGSMTVIFDGFAQLPEGSIGPEVQQVAFNAVGVATRCYDSTLNGAEYRDADDPNKGQVTRTVLPVRFNPSDGSSLAVPNATPDGQDYGGAGNVPDGSSGAYPVFIDPSPDRADDEDEDEADETDGDDDAAEPGDTRRFWNLSMATKNLLWNPQYGNGNQVYVKNPDTTDLDDQMMAVSPKTPGTGIDLTDDSTYKIQPVIIRDYDGSNESWPEAIKAIIWPYGLRFRYALETDGDDGTPKTTIKFYRRDGLFGNAPKTLKLQARGDDLDPGKSNVGSMGITRTPARFSRVVIETGPVLYEVAVILAPGFMINVADAATAAAMKPFDRSNLETDYGGDEAKSRFYRWWIYDECGDGHWDHKANAWSTKPGGENGIDFGAVFNPDSKSQKRTYVRRYRPGRKDLISTIDGTPLGEPIPSQLHVSKDLKTFQPGVWDGSGTWQPVLNGWRPLKDRLGIEVTIESPNAWNIGKPPMANANDVIGGNGKLNIIEHMCQANGKPLVFFRYTTVIEADHAIEAVARKRDAAATRFVTTARIDCRANFKKLVIDQSSPFLPDDTAKGKQRVLRDDTAKAVAFAEAKRAVGERSNWQGTATIPRFTTAYEIGDRISGIAGRTTTFQCNVGTGTGESPTYPTIVGMTWNFGESQTTTLELADTPDEPHISDPSPGYK